MKLSQFEFGGKKDLINNKLEEDKPKCSVSAKRHQRKHQRIKTTTNKILTARYFSSIYRKMEMNQGPSIKSSKCQCYDARKCSKEQTL